MTTSFAPLVETEIFDLRPDYAAISVVAEGIDNRTRHSPIDQYVEETVASRSFPEWTDSHLQAWREAYRAFGAKPQRTPCSADALLARLKKDQQLPTVNGVVDLYNAISVRFAIPIGGENLAAYVGNPRLKRATGSEAFTTLKDGQPLTETVPVGEVIWVDDHGVTCRRWNWRQGLRTRIDTHTSRAWFVLERLEPMPMDAGVAAASALMEVLRLANSGVRLEAQRIDRHGTTAIIQNRTPIHGC